MSSVVISGDTSGAITLQAPAVSGNTTLNLPASSGTVLTQNSSAPANSLVVDASGNVGIGTSSPSTKLHVSGAGDITSRTQTTNAGVYYELDTPASPSDYKTYWGTTNGVRKWGIGNFGTGNDSVLAFYTNGTTERMRIDSSGNVLINTTSVQGGLPVKIGVDNTGSSSGSFVFTNDAGGNQWTGWVWNKATTGNNLFIQFATEGTLTGRGSITYNRASNVTAFNTTSDKRLKENIVQAPSAISKIESIKIRSFDWKETGNHVDFGVIAQELYEVAPESVTEGSDNPDGSIRNYWGVDTSVLVPALIKAVQELKAIVDEQAEKIKALEAK